MSKQLIIRKDHENGRAGASLVESLVAITVLALLVGLLAPAVQKARAMALRIQSQNQLRQIGIGLHHYADANGRLPGFASPIVPSSADAPPLSAILPFVEAKPGPRVPLYMDPGDPTSVREYAFQSRNRTRGNSGYAVNKLAFDGLPNLASGFPDGTAATIAAVEHYARCGPFARFNFIYSLRYSLAQSDDPYTVHEIRRATFADAHYGDVVPVPDGSGGSQPSRPGATFQAGPTPDSCDPTIPQTSFTGGMPVLFVDGSVRVVPASVSPAVFWAAVTRDGGEVASLD